MRLTFVVAAALAAISFAPTSQAATGLPGVPAGHDITLVEGGCGPGGFRAANGYCYRRRMPPPRRYYRHRECPPGFHLSRYGCRRNF